MRYFIKRPHIKMYMAGIKIIVCNIFKTSFVFLYLLGSKRQVRAKIIKNISRIDDVPVNLSKTIKQASIRIYNTVKILNNTLNVIRQYLLIERSIAYYGK